MEANANFVPLEAVDENAYFDTGDKQQQATGKTKEERKELARRIRLAAKKEKKKIKSDAKKQRKENAIQHRRATKNVEKYAKNKGRNTMRAIELERFKVRMEAVRQAERLAAKHDQSGKMFNVGEVIVLEDGKVKNKEIWKKAQEAKNAKEAGAELKKDPAPPDTASVANTPGINPDRVALIQTGHEPGQKKLSNKQQKKLAALQPKALPPKPVLPEGIDLPEGEENFIAMWDITDEDIQHRLSVAKGKKKQAAKALRRQQKEQQKFNKAMKIKRKQAANEGVIWDPAKAKKEIMGEMSEEAGSDSDSESDSDSGSDSSSDSGDGGVKLSPEKEDAKAKSPESKKSKRSEDEDVEGEPKAKKSKKSKSRSDDVEMADTKEPAAQEGTTPVKKSKLKDKHKHVPKDRAHILGAEEIEKSLAKEERRARKDLKRQEAAAALKAQEDAERIKKKEAKEAKKRSKQAEETQEVESLVLEQSKETKKRKRSKEQPEDEHKDEDEKAAKKSSKKKHKKSAEASEPTKEDIPTNGHAPNAEQWNADALSGDAARKEKFLRLLGAGKNKGSSAEETTISKKSSKKSAADISHVQSELERQYEAGMKMKHDGLGKRRGLGA